MLSNDQVLSFIEKKLTVKKLISRKIISVKDVCNFLGIDSKIYEMIFGSATGMKIQQIPSVITENMDNLIKIAKINITKKFHLNDLSTAPKNIIIDFCIADMYILFTNKNIDDFWQFINFITSKNVLSEANLISISFEYQRSEIDLFEKIWWYLTSMFARVLKHHEASSIDPQLIANLILSRRQNFFSYFDIIRNSEWNDSFLSKRIDGFEKLFFKYPPNRIPAMFWDTKLFPTNKY
jgi:hypothetical protein